MTLAYDGSNYVGWQVQSNGLAIQSVVEAAVEKLTGEKVCVYSAGRTDSGVHAIGQVVNFHTRSTIPASQFRPALQSFLPEDVVILESSLAPPGFHATFSAKRKRYRYVIDNGAVPLPMLRKYAWSIRKPLDVAAMQRAARSLVGTHDFRSFETDWPNKATSVRTVMELTVRRWSSWAVWFPTPPAPGHPLEPSETVSAETDSGSFVCVDIVADGFLYNMVRAITGTLVNVGRGTWDEFAPARILAAQSRSEAGNTAPAEGLYLLSVEY
jgi:tRNA pseudouridine38-40 synthase